MVNNIDFLIDTAKHPGFLIEQPTTGFFDKHLKNILSHLSAKSRLRNHEGNLSDHSVLAIAAINQYQKDQGDNSCERPIAALQQLWSSSASDWRPLLLAVC